MWMNVFGSSCSVVVFGACVPNHQNCLPIGRKRLDCFNFFWRTLKPQVFITARSVSILMFHPNSSCNFHLKMSFSAQGLWSCSAKDSILTTDNGYLWLKIDAAAGTACNALLPAAGGGMSLNPLIYLRNQQLWLKLLAAKLQVVCVCQIFRPAVSPAEPVIKVAFHCSVEQNSRGCCIGRAARGCSGALKWWCGLRKSPCRTVNGVLFPSVFTFFHQCVSCSK